jgi:activator of HSP90 ATPase
MKTKTLHQTISFNAAPHDVYEALMDSKKHTEFTEAKAVISRSIGGKFTAFDDWASGTNVELVKDKKIVQTWRGADWPEGHYSTITFALKQKEKETMLDFTQTEIPEDLYDDVKQGWIDWYWNKLKAYVVK